MPTINLTDKNLELLKAVVEVMKAEINWDEVAKKADMKTSKYARDQWTVVRNKLLAGDGDGKAALGTKRKDSAASTPAPTPKKTKTTKGKKAGSRAASEGVADEDDISKVKEEAEKGVDEDTFKGATTLQERRFAQQSGRDGHSRRLSDTFYIQGVKTWEVSEC